jgi:Ca-activated chloride channel homolog
VDIRIEQPLWLLLFIPIGIYIIYTWRSSGQRMKSRSTILFVLRGIAVALLIFALTSPYLTLRVTEEQVLFVVDRSASIEEVGTAADSWILESLKGRKENHSVGIYSFAENFRTDVKLANTDVVVPVIDRMEKNEATDIAKAIDLSSALANRNLATRIVLLSDGLETAGSIEKILPKFKDKRTVIDTVLLERPAGSDASITSFETPRTSYAGEQQLLRVEIEASERTTGKLFIYENDQVISQQEVKLEQGGNLFSVKRASSNDGLLKYEAKLVVSDDKILENNRMVSVTMIESSPRVLVVETDRNPSIIPTLLDQEAMDVETINAKLLPETLSGYMGYSAIIFDNVPGHIVGENRMTIIEQAVKKFGTGFMMVGGEESFGLGGYFKSPIERLLPVEMEIKGKEQLPSLGLIIVLDRSGSMSGSKIVLAREAAARSVELLRDDDTFGFIAFDDQVWNIIPLAPLGDRNEAIEKILSVSALGGTDIYPGMKQAYDDLTNSDLQRKHIILLTDGQSEMPPGYEEVIADGKGGNITMSTVAIGSDADRGLLESLAESGGGRFYDVIDESTVPAILSRETSMMTRTYIEDEPFYMSLGGVPEWNALFSEGVPEMNAYIATTLKNTATLIGESTKEDPVLSEWMYGLGRTVAFTSDSTGKWTGDFAKWGGYGDFWNTAVGRLLPAYEDVPYIITHEHGGTYTVMDSSRSAAFLDVAIIDEKGAEVPYTSEPLAPGKVRVTVDANPGLVFFGITDDKGGYFEAGISVPYNEEYKRIPSNVKLLEKIAHSTDGLMLEDPIDAFRSHSYKSGEKKLIAQGLILAAMIFFFIDITLRRFGFFKGFGSKRLAEERVLDTSTTAEESFAELLKNKRKR